MEHLSGDFKNISEVKDYASDLFAEVSIFENKLRHFRMRQFEYNETLQPIDVYKLTESLKCIQSACGRMMSDMVYALAIDTYVQNNED